MMIAGHNIIVVISFYFTSWRKESFFWS